MIQTLKRPGSESPVGAYAAELLNASTILHKLHLKITGPGSYAAHAALGELYGPLKDFADEVVEQYQGRTEMICTIPAVTESFSLNSVDDALSYLRELTSKTDSLQNQLSAYSEIVNTLDEVKSAINKAKYKLKFLS